MNWNLDPSVIYLNHGAFGACPLEIINEQRHWQQRLESSPLRFILREIDEKLYESKHALSRFIDTDTDGLALVPNATHGVNTILKSLDFKPGDEVLITNHIYPACRNVLFYILETKGIKIKEIELPLGEINSQLIINSVMEAVTPATRLVMLDHVTSPTALVFPVTEIVKELNRRGIESLIDGAHAPGSIPLSIKTINPTYYTGNCHKWMCLPKNCGFLWVREEARSKVVPLAISHAWGKETSFEKKFHWQGTADWSAALTLPYAIRFFEKQMPGGWGEWMERNHQMTIEARGVICNYLGLKPICSISMLASMAVIPIAAKADPINLGYNTIDRIQEQLYQKYNIEVPLFQWTGAHQLLLRISSQQYNTLSQFHYLAESLDLIISNK
ncbi:MAG: aminotransferase [Bacteroidetes bacterium HGW-Bacteroidetes-22]|nr:MAG: aminotransferase [Bacteroidetes bacterium HGW-Bacteroidetes-22]